MDCSIARMSEWGSYDSDRTAPDETGDDPIERTRETAFFRTLVENTSGAIPPIGGRRWTVSANAAIGGVAGARNEKLVGESQLQAPTDHSTGARQRDRSTVRRGDQ